MKGLFLFQRDLRLEDQLGLSLALSQSSELLLSAVFDESCQGLSLDLPLGFNASTRLGALKNLENELRQRQIPITIGIGDTISWVLGLCEINAIEQVWLNAVLEPKFVEKYSILGGILSEKGIRLILCHDDLAITPSQAVNKSGTAYKVFTPFYRHWRSQLSESVLTPCQMPWSQPMKFISITDSQLATSELLREAVLRWQALPVKADDSNPQSRWQDFKTASIKTYENDRDYPAKAGTSQLSAAINNGQISYRQLVRESIATPGGEAFLRQLAWRNFYQLVLLNFPYVAEGAFLRAFNHLTWENDPIKFQRWKDGETGFPLIDAAMRQLKQEGRMHNRLRMITASFLVKQLDIDWRWGEAYFYEQLRDGDLAANNGGWQWCASTGTDAQPYFRIFNPLRQSERYDPQWDYTSEWLSPEEFDPISGRRYADHQILEQMVDLTRTSQYAKLKYQYAKKGGEHEEPENHR